VKIAQVKEIANAVLYEGYLLYPYRHSAIKNRQRWTFGVVYPRAYSEASEGLEPWTMHTECLVSGQDPSIDVYIRFLHLIQRTVDKGGEQSSEDTHTKRMLGYQAPEAWEEGMEREVCISELDLNELVASLRLVEINFPGDRMMEQGRTGEVIVREQQPLAGDIILSAERLDTNLFKLSIHIENRTLSTNPGTDVAQAEAIQRPPMLQSFVSTHTLLQVRQGVFISLLEPPEAVQDAVQSCQNIHTWPVLVGNEGECDTMLSSPIILYDYPQIAPESPGPLFDGTEIDEILMLRILTLSDEEKQEIRQGDERAREILERTESLSPEQFMKLHGVIRNLKPAAKEGKV
jgi:hypothetical protein